MSVQSNGKMVQDQLREEGVEVGEFTEVSPTNGRQFVFTLVRRIDTGKVEVFPEQKEIRRWRTMKIGG